ncbi:hypothetical protein B296_00042452 [Ensete ventricosum]|uniref:Uncharacterized protein n=1 Tax=Ensete ventricosum TaxID=4639 RepID=A0A426Y1U2_ENSVE|nr:hypothetical protein B296_00042452 [Ensete ventricosum]
MSQERPFGNSGAEHHSEPNHPQPTEEAATAVPTPNCFWRMMTDPGFPSPASNPASFVVTVEAFLDLTTQVQALAGMVQTIVSYLPQLMQSTAHQSAPPTAPSQTKTIVSRLGHLCRYVRDQSSLPDGRPPQGSSPRPKGPVEKQIDVIFGRPASGGNSSARKVYARFEVVKRPLHDEYLDVTFNSHQRTTVSSGARPSTGSRRSFRPIIES